MTKRPVLITFTVVLALCHSALSLALSCGDAITSDITLTEDLDCASGYTALEVFADNVTIDLGGHNLSGTVGLAGVTNLGFDNLTVKNGLITGFWAGVNTHNVDNLSVNSIVFYDVATGVIVSQGNNGNIQGNDFIKTRSHGVFIVNRDSKTNANNNAVNNNEFYQARFGIGICGDQADSNIITNNLLWKTADYAIHLNQSDRNTIHNNRVLDSDSTALRLNNSSYNQIEGNSFRQGRQNGISILAKAGDACLLSGSTKSHKNTVRGNHSIGFQTGVALGLGIDKSPNVLKNLVTGNKLYDNNIGVFFHQDAHHNNSPDNGYQGTIITIEDHGISNSY